MNLRIVFEAMGMVSHPLFQTFQKVQPWLDVLHTGQEASGCLHRAVINITALCLGTGRRYPMIPDLESVLGLGAQMG